MASKRELADFQELIKWSLESFHELPWRNNRSLYTTLVSELMLQQTTVGTVLNHFERFLKIYPTLESLASSTEEDLLIAWKGLGYYRRAKSLLKACSYIHNELKGAFPQTREELMEIPGVGPYTSSALISIGANQKDIAVDANLERVLARYYGVDFPKGLKLQKELYKMFQAGEIVSFDEAIDKISYRDLNESLMDVGRQICRARKVDCVLCPLKKGCQAYKTGKLLEIPQIVEKKKKTKLFELELLRVIVRDSDRLLGYKKEEGQWLSGQFEIPTYIISSEDKTLSQYPQSIFNDDDLISLKSYKTSITKYKIKNYVLEIDIDKFRHLERSSKYSILSSREESNLSTGSSKALNLA